jgi:sortase A
MARSSSRARPVRAVLRFVASVMMVSGLLMLADAGVTLAWQEPISALLADRQQGELRTEFRNPPVRVLRRKPLEGDAIAKLEMPTINKTTYVVQGTDMSTLRKGPGHYPETPLPGDRGTVAIAGHRTTYGAPFRNVDKLQRGDRITVAMPDGDFVYRVEQNRIVDNDATWVKRQVAHDRLVLTACHPLYSAAQRVAVFARFVRREPPSVTR